MNNCITKLLLCHFYNTKIRYSHLRKRKKEKEKKSIMEILLKIH